MQVLEKYKQILSSYENGQTTLRNVTIVLSGHKPHQLINNTTSGCVIIDDNLKNISGYPATERYPIASRKYSHLLKWKGKGAISPAEIRRLRFCVAAAHKNGSKVRLWAAPQNKAVWSELLKCNVDLINTDQLTSLRRFLIAANAGSFLIPVIPYCFLLTSIVGFIFNHYHSDVFYYRIILYSSEKEASCIFLLNNCGVFH